MVTRYDPYTEADALAGMDNHPSGDYVEYADYVELLEKFEGFRGSILQELGALEKIVDNY